MQELLKLEFYTYVMVFLRFGTAIMVMPGFTSSYVNPRIRLYIALGISFILYPVLQEYYPPEPQIFLKKLELGFHEITIGLIMGLLMQFYYFALNLAGNFAGQAIGFSNATLFDPTSQNQSIVLESFLSITAITVIFVLDIHHLMIEAVLGSYRIFPPAESIMYGDTAKLFSQTIGKSFKMGFQLSSPFIAFTIVFYTGMGLISRLMPQLNIFFLSLPLQIYLGLGLLFITTPVMIMWFAGYFEGGIKPFVP